MDRGRVSRIYLKNLLGFYEPLPNDHAGQRIGLATALRSPQNEQMPGAINNPEGIVSFMLPTGKICRHLVTHSASRV
jgi:hypothetical protein